MDEMIALVRRLFDFCTVNLQNKDSVQMTSQQGLYGSIPKVDPYGEIGDSVLLGVLTEYFQRVELLEGEVELYTNTGTRILLNQAGGVAITPSNDEPVTINGNLNVTGNVSDANGSMQEMRDTYNSHTHPGDSGGTTGATSQTMS